MRSWLDFQETSLGESEVSLGAVFKDPAVKIGLRTSRDEKVFGEEISCAG